MPAKRKPKTALRGAVNNIIIESLFDGEKYGYEIIKEVEDKTNGKIKLKQPSLYSSLKRFESKGYIESYWQDSDIGGKRHYYRITPEGVKYYKKNILKEDIEDDFEDIEEDEENIIPIAQEDEDSIDEQLGDYEIDEDDGNNDLTKYEYNVEDKLNSLLGNEEVEEEILDELYDEIEDTEKVYTEDDLNNDTSKEEIVLDHEFAPPTPISNLIDVSDNAYEDIMSDEEDNNNIFDDIDLNKTYESKESIEDKAEEIENTTQSKEKSKIYIDEDGITRMYYGDDEQKKNNKVFDNVVLRTASQDLYSNKLNKKSNTEEIELTDEEKELKSKLFFEKFDNKSEQIKREKELSRANEPKKQVEEKIDYNYKSKLNNLFDTTISDDDEIEFDNSEDDYNELDDSYDFQSHINIINEENEEDESQNDMRIFTKEKEKTSYNKYLHVNKAKFTFGLSMLIFMLFQVTVMLIIFKNKGLLMDNQFWVFELSYIIVAVIALIYCIPVFISPNKQSSNVFRLGYSLMFGIISFFIVVIFTYAINTFLGMELFNIKYYLATLIVPIVLSLNFIAGPLIYWLITQNKKFY